MCVSSFSRGRINFLCIILLWVDMLPRGAHARPTLSAYHLWCFLLSSLMKKNHGKNGLLAKGTFLNHGLLRIILKTSRQVVKELPFFSSHWGVEWGIETWGELRQARQSWSPFSVRLRPWVPSLAWRIKEKFGSSVIFHRENSNICPWIYGEWFTILT